MLYRFIAVALLLVVRGQALQRELVEERRKGKNKGKYSLGDSTSGGVSRSLRIVLTNDDGFETDLIQSLFSALTNAGHVVVMSAPYSGQSGTSGLIQFLTPVLPTSAPSPKGTVPAGSPGVGETGIADGQFYVNGAVTSAVLNGLDVVGPQYFGPNGADLVISGPNEGNNVGLLTPHSGTIGAVVTAMNRGIPSLAVSADTEEKNPDLVADIVVQLVKMITTETGFIIPPSKGINVNVGNTDGYTSVSDFEFRATKIGLAGSVGLQFTDSLQYGCPIGAAFGLPPLDFPGMCLAIPYTAAGYPADESANSEGNAILAGPVVALSAMQGTFQADADTEATIFGGLGL